MFVWSSSASPVSEAGGLHVFSGADFGASDQSGRSDQGAKEIRMLVADDHPQNGETNKGTRTRFFILQNLDGVPLSTLNTVFLSEQHKKPLELEFLIG